MIPVKKWNDKVLALFRSIKGKPSQKQVKAKIKVNSKERVDPLLDLINEEFRKQSGSGGK